MNVIGGRARGTRCAGILGICLDEDPRRFSLHQGMKNHGMVDTEIEARVGSGYEEHTLQN